jgi:hypothetical protein
LFYAELVSGQSGISAVDQILRNVDVAGIQDERAREGIHLLLNLIESLTADLRKAQAEILYLREQLNRRKGGGGKPDQPKDTAGAQPQSSEKERAETKQRTRRSKLDRIRIDREEVLKLYLLNKSGRLRGSPRRTEAHSFSSLFDQIRQRWHLPGSAYPVADVLKEVHSRFFGSAQQRFHRVPGPGTSHRARTVAHHSLSDSCPRIQLCGVVVQGNLGMLQHHQVRFVGPGPGDTLVQLIVAEGLGQLSCPLRHWLQRNRRSRGGVLVFRGAEPHGKPLRSPGPRCSFAPPVGNPSDTEGDGRVTVQKKIRRPGFS